MAPKNKKAAPEPEKFEAGQTVLVKLKGYPEWPGKIRDHADASDELIKARQGKAYLVRFFPDGDHSWFGAREMKPLTEKAIEAFLSDSSKKSGKLRQGYEIARDPKEWEEEQARLAEAEDDEDEDVDMLQEDPEKKPKDESGNKRKRSDGKKKDDKSKKESSAKKRKTDDKSDKKSKDKPVKGAAASAAKDKKAGGDDDSSDGSKITKGWRATLQKAFLTKGVPEADKMPSFDKIFSEMEGFDMQSEWLTSSKLGKVLKRMAALPDILRNEEFKISQRAGALAEKWKEMIMKEGGDEAGDMTVLPADNDAEDKKAEVKKSEDKPEDKKEEKPVEATTSAPKAVEANGKMEVDEKKDTNGAVHADEKMKTDTDTDPTPQVNGEAPLNSA